MKTGMSSTIRRDKVDNDGRISERFQELLREEPPAGKPSEVYLSAPSLDLLEEISRIDFDEDSIQRTVTVLFDTTMEREIQGNFLLGSRLVERSDHVTYVTVAADDISALPVISTPDELLALVTLDSTTHELVAGNEADPADAYAKYQELAENASDANFRMPSRSKMYATLADGESYDDFGEELARDYQALLEALEDNEGVDNAEISLDSVLLLAGAKHEVPQYDLGRWAENVGAASKATVSRRKQRLEDLGIINTTKIPRDIGRPRQRLHLADDSKDSIEDLAEIAGDLP